jgi:hypothetical protein
LARSAALATISAARSVPIISWAVVPVEVMRAPSGVDEQVGCPGARLQVGDADGPFPGGLPPQRQ